jgi:pilus assembly protein Flp/PilA
MLSLGKANRGRELIHNTDLKRPLKLWMLSGTQRLITREEGLDLVEYALVLALIALAAVASIQTLSGDINIDVTPVGVG